MTVFYRDLGKDRSYKEIWDLQETLLQKNVQLKQKRSLQNDTGFTSKVHTTNHLFFVEHTPVYTLGKSGKLAHVLISEEERKSKSIEFFKINRGGDITFHGPGQLVVYPVLDLENFKTDLGWYLRSLEEVIILTLDEYGIKGARSKGETGVWIDATNERRQRKICAMGVRCSRWITMHGLALNVNTDLAYFNHIIPCGIYNKEVTSLKKELEHEVSIEEVKKRLLINFEKVFDININYEVDKNLRGHFN